jgi:hypothetical protein
MEARMRGDTEYLTTGELASRWRLSAWTIRDYARRGLIDGATRVGREFRFATSAALRTPPTVRTPATLPPGATTAARQHMIFDDFDRRLSELRAR